MEPVTAEWLLYLKNFLWWSPASESLWIELKDKRKFLSGYGTIDIVLNKDVT